MKNSRNSIIDDDEDEATENETIENDIVQTVTTLKSGTEKLQNQMKYKI